MLVKMKTAIGGYRNGEAWPPVGGTIDLPDHEAADMIANGYAEPTEEAADAPAPAADDDAPTDPVDDDSVAADDGNAPDPADPVGAPDQNVDDEPVKPKRTRKA